MSLLNRLLLACLVAWQAATAATLPADWQYHQSFAVTNGGITKLSLPVSTLGAARPGLEDVRLYNDAGSEVPYLIVRPSRVPRLIESPKRFAVSLNRTGTTVTIETGVQRPIEAVSLTSPANRFIKPVLVEGSTNGSHWQSLSEGHPIFRQPYGAEQLYIPLPTGVWPWLRLTVDDLRSPPVPFTGATLHGALDDSAPVERFSATIMRRQEDTGESRLIVNLGAANLNIANIQLQTDRPVAVAMPHQSDGVVTEETIAKGVIYRVAVEGHATSASLEIPVEQQARSAQLAVVIKNHDSPPLPVKGVQVERRPVYLVFHAAQTGRYYLVTGNSGALAPSYDLTRFGSVFQATPVASIALPPVEPNPSYRAPEVLAGIGTEGSTIDLRGWQHRKRLQLSRDGAQELELDLDVLANTARSLADVRIVRDGYQIPYLLEHTPRTRIIAPTVSVTNDVQNPTVTRWLLGLPRENLPITRLTCSSGTAIFQRNVQIYEDLPRERERNYRRVVGSATWIRTPGSALKELQAVIRGPLSTDSLIVEISNGDNPPIQLRDFQLHCSTPRLLFKASSQEGVYLYYGNSEAVAPRYDIALVSEQLLTADKAIVRAGEQEDLKKNKMAGLKGGAVFWAALAVVVIGLLFVIARLLPKPPAA